MIAAAWLTAIGTLAVAVAAVWVALWSERGAARRVAAEHERSDRQLADQRASHEQELADERAHSAQRLASQQAFSQQQLEDERKQAQDREQLAEAYAVQIVHAETPGTPLFESTTKRAPDVRSLAALVVNHGAYTITRVEAQFRLSPEGNATLHSPDKTDWISGFERLDERLRDDMDGPPQYSPYTTKLSSWDVGIRFRANNLATKYTFGWYPIVRWTDRWGTRWEHKLGEVRQIDESAIWEP